MKFHKSTSWNRWIIGGNRSGKTEAGGVEVNWAATDTHPWQPPKNLSDLSVRPIRIAVVSRSHSAQRDTIQPKVEKYLMRDRVLRIIPGQKGATDTILFNRGATAQLGAELGCTLVFKTLEMGREKMEGGSWDLVWFDEEPPHAIYVELLRGLVDTGGSCIGTMTPVKGSASWTMDELFNNPTVSVIPASIHDNTHNSPDFVARYLATLSPEERAAREFGSYVTVGGLIYGSYDTRVHELPVLYLPRPQDTVMCGIDTGRHFAVVYTAFRPEGDAVAFEEVYTEDQSAADNAGWMRVIEAKLTKAGSPVRIRFIDPGSQIKRDLAEAGIMTTPARNEIDAGIQTVRRMLKFEPAPARHGLGSGNPKLYLTPNMMRSKWEIKRYQWDRYKDASKMSGELLNRPVKKNDHAMDALRYSCSYLPGQMAYLTQEAVERIPAKITQEWIQKVRDKIDKREDESDSFHPAVGPI